MKRAKCGKGKALLIACLSLLLTAALSVSAFADYNSMGNFYSKNPYSAGQFGDVSGSEWYAENVRNSYEMDLFRGMSANEFQPEGNLTIAQTLALASRLSSIYESGTANFVQGDVWYQVYVDYCIAHGIIYPGEYSDYNALATRAQFASIMSKALPNEALYAINTVGKIPDIGGNENYAQAVYALYNAGILTGSDGLGTYHPADFIKRSEVATIVTRMAKPSERRRFTLNSQSAQVQQQTQSAGALTMTFSPQNGASDVNMTADIVIRFPSAVSLSGGSAMTSTNLLKVVDLRKNNSNGTSVLFTATMNNSSTMLTISPRSRLDAGTRYYVWVRSGAFENSNGAVNNDTVISFTTKAEDDSISFSPRDGATSVKVGVNPSISFNNAITDADGNDLTANYLRRNIIFRLSNSNGRDIPFTARYSSAGRMISIEPDGKLAEGQRYYIEIPSGVLRSPNGTLRRQSFSFTTAYSSSSSSSSSSASKSTLSNMNGVIYLGNTKIPVDLNFSTSKTSYQMNAYDGSSMAIYAGANSSTDVLIAAYRDTSERNAIQTLTYANSYSFDYIVGDSDTPARIVVIARPKTGETSRQTKYTIDLVKTEIEVEEEEVEELVEDTVAASVSAGDYGFVFSDMEPTQYIADTLYDDTLKIDVYPVSNSARVFIEGDETAHKTVKLSEGNNYVTITIRNAGGMKGYRLYYRYESNAKEVVPQSVADDVKDAGAEPDTDKLITESTEDAEASGSDASDTEE